MQSRSRRFCSLKAALLCTGGTLETRPVRPPLWHRLFACFWLWFGIASVNQSAGAPGILITNLPAYGTSDSLGGLVLGAAPATSAIAVFIYVPGYGWVTKPTCAQALTGIQGDGSWSANVTTGGSDELATRMAALLVGTNYNQPCVLGAQFLPTNVFLQALAGAVVTRQYPGPRWVSFSGYNWWVKTSSGPVGPGPNYFSDSTNNVWLDGQSQLHLRITNRSNQWQCAEIVSARTFGYGSYRFELGSRVDNLNANVVLGLFTWSDDPAHTHREIDVECSRFGNATDPNNAQFVVQPYTAPGHLVRFAIPAGLTNSTHYFTWQTNQVNFQSQRGSYSPAPNPTNVINTWTYLLDVPQTGDENIRMNLWLFNGTAPTDNQEVEVVLKSFNFVPLAPPQSALLKDLNRSNGQMQFTMVSEPDRRYGVLGSTNLVSWENLAEVLATNIQTRFTDTNSAAFQYRFFRTLTLP